MKDRSEKMKTGRLYELVSHDENKYLIPTKLIFIYMPVALLVSKCRWPI